MGLFDPTIPTGTTTSQTTSELPAWLQDYYRQVLGMGAAGGEIPYTPYPGPRIAEPEPALQQSWGMAGQNVGSWEPAYYGALTAAGRGATPFQGEESLAPFMNPYMQDVVGETGRLGMRNLQETLLPGVSDAFTQAGQPFSTREFDFRSKTIRDTLADIAGKQGQLMAGGFNTALTGYGAEQGRQIAGSGALSNLATQRQQLGAGDVAQLGSVGQQQTLQVQKNYDLAYQDFLKQRGYTQEQITWMMNLAKGAPSAQMGSSSTTGTAPYSGTTGPSTVGQIGSILGTIGTIFGGKRGGSVPGALRRMAHGGKVRKREQRQRTIEV